MIRQSLAVFFCLAVLSCGPVSSAVDSDATVDEALTSTLSITSVSASANDGNVPANVLDGSYSTRWSAEGNGAWIQVDLGSAQQVGSVLVAWYHGTQRSSTWQLSTSTDGVSFARASSGTSSGTTNRLETYTITSTRARYVRLTVFGNTQNDWASVTELRIGVGQGGTVVDAGAPVTPDAGTPVTPTPDAGTVTPPSGGSAYETLVLADSPVALWAMSKPSTGKEPDLSGHGHTGTYQGTPALVALPNGSQAVDFDGASQLLSIPSSAAFSIPTTGTLTWEAWIRPDVLQFPNDTSDGYVDWMGKCASYSPTCEWEARMYDLTTPEVRPNRFSAYVFNSSAGLGSGADWQPVSGTVVAGHWYHVVGEYQVLSAVAGCAGPQIGGINIWVNGVLWNQSYHGDTGCMSQYGITPKASTSPVNIGSMALDSWFKGAVGEVAIYDHLLTQAQITAHYKAMTNQAPTGSCAASCSL